MNNKNRIPSLFFGCIKIIKNHNIIAVVLACLLISFKQVMAREANLDYLFDAELEQLFTVKITSASLYEQSAESAHANITVITQKMIEQRGYRNLIEVMQDVPGFDFTTFADGGEFPIHNVNRGIGGDVGNPKILIMIDGVVQNYVSFNWSTGWGNEQILHDLERIEVIQGPGSTLYGANAYSGLIHLITQNYRSGVQTKLWLAEHNTRGVDFLAGKTFSGGHAQIAVRNYNSDGDNGLDRPDPGNYFHHNIAPYSLLENYNESGQYIINSVNPNGGMPLLPGFDTSRDDWAVRGKINYKKFSAGLFYWDKTNGLGSYTSGFEYDTRGNSGVPFRVHQSGYHVYGTLIHDVWKNLSLKSTLLYRVTENRPDTQFSYHYRFPGLAKSYNSSGSQLSLREQLDYNLDKHRFITGLQLQRSRKMPEVVSLGAIQGDAQSIQSSSCWFSRFNGLNQPCYVERQSIKEHALYWLWDGEFHQQLKHSIGIRYDHSDEFNDIITPRFSLIYEVQPSWHVQFLYGSAFRQPSIFEFKDEFRGNPDLNPEEVDTYEIENHFFINDRWQLRANVFWSFLHDLIVVVPDASSSSGERFQNISTENEIGGLSLVTDYQVHKNLSFYLNYIYTQGREDNEDWGDIDHVARNKFNVGVNWLTWQNRLNINVRANIVGKRKTPKNNAMFHGDHAPGYEKVNLTLTWYRMLGNKDFKSQLIVNNLFDESYYGVGRQSGSNDRNAYDPITNPDPISFIPPYHPQPGREFFFNISYQFK